MEWDHSIFLLYYVFQKLLNVCLQPLKGWRVPVVGVLAEHCGYVALAVTVGCQFVVVLLAVVGITLNLLLAFAAQMSAYGLHDAHRDTVHDMVSLDVEIGLIGCYAKRCHLLAQLDVLLLKVWELSFKHAYVVLHTLAQLL